MNALVHPSADVASKAIGRGTRIWQFLVVLAGARIGEDCSVCSRGFIENDVVLGDRVTIKSGVQLWGSLRVDDDVFIGSNTTFTSDRFPRSEQCPSTYAVTTAKSEASPRRGAAIMIGRGAAAATCAIVTQSVLDNGLAGSAPRGVAPHRVHSARSKVHRKSRNRVGCVCKQESDLRL